MSTPLSLKVTRPTLRLSHSRATLRAVLSRWSSLRQLQPRRLGFQHHLKVIPQRTKHKARRSVKSLSARHQLAGLRPLYTPLPAPMLLPLPSKVLTTAQWELWKSLLPRRALYTPRSPAEEQLTPLHWLAVPTMPRAPSRQDQATRSDEAFTNN